MKAAFHWAAFMIAVLLAPASQAVPIASDSFFVGTGGYVPFTSILGQSPTVGASGFVGAWGNCCTGSMVVVSGGLTHPLTPGATSDGRLVSYTSNGTVGGGNARNLSRAIDYTPSDGTYYMSLLINKSDAPPSRHMFAGLAPLQHPETGVFQVEGTWIGVFEGGIWFFEGPGGFLDPVLPASQMNANETYFALLQYNFSTSGPDSVTTTIYDGSSQEVATRAFTGLNVDQSMARFSVFTQDFGPNPSVDEWRFGTELSDVMVPPQLAGDYNNNGVVDAADYVVWRDNEGTTTSLPNDNGIGGMIGQPHYDLWRAHFGQTAAGGTALPSAESLSAAVPEPAGPLLLLLGTVGSWRARRNASEVLAFHVRSPRLAR